MDRSTGEEVGAQLVEPSRVASGSCGAGGGLGSVESGDGQVVLTFDPATDSCPPSGGGAVVPLPITLEPSFTG